jgi:hypothetical protein
MANRRSARASRERRKKLLSDLQEQVNKLRAEAQELLSENRSLRAQLVSTGGLPLQPPPTGMDANRINNAGVINQSLPNAGMPLNLQNPTISNPTYTTMPMNQIQSNGFNAQLDLQRLLQSSVAARGLTNEDIIALIRRQHGL